jgi:hypothetical protein
VKVFLSYDVLMHTWLSELETIITNRYAVGQLFTLADVYQLEPHFRPLYPKNRHIPEKLRQTLQSMRDAGSIEFVDDAGTYRRLRR